MTGDPESIDDFVTGIAPVLGPGELTVEDVTEVLPARDPREPLMSGVDARPVCPSRCAAADSRQLAHRVPALMDDVLPSSANN